jgi:hypothetical protein
MLETEKATQEVVEIVEKTSVNPDHLVYIIDNTSIYEIDFDKNNESLEALIRKYLLISQMNNVKVNDEDNYVITEYSINLFVVYSEPRPMSSHTPIFGFGPLPQLTQIIVDMADWWARAYPVIETISTVSGAITDSAAVISAPFLFIKWFRGKMNTANEASTIQQILYEDKWSITELAEKYDLDRDKTKRVLKGFGYKWDNKKMIYCKTELTDKLRNIQLKDKKK